MRALQPSRRIKRDDVIMRQFWIPFFHLQVHGGNNNSVTRKRTTYSCSTTLCKSFYLVQDILLYFSFLCTYLEYVYIHLFSFTHCDRTCLVQDIYFDSHIIEQIKQDYMVPHQFWIPFFSSL